MRMLIAGVVALLSSVASAPAADLEANRELYRNFIEDVWNKRRPSAVDQYLAANFVEHNPNLPPGLDGRKKFVAAVQAGFSDYRAEIQEIVAQGDRVVARVVWTGTQDGPFLDRPATGNKVRFATADFFRIENGRLAEHWDVVDSLPRAIALGLVSPPQPANRPPAAKP
jgi:predicted ester cyclase